MKCSVLLALVVLGVLGASARPPRRDLPLLQDADTHAAVHEVARHAQKSDSDVDIRLMPKMDTHTNDHWAVCCLHANILDFYLHGVLPRQPNMHPKMHQLREDLSRVSRDLKRHGCSIPHYKDNPHSLAFSKKLTEMGEDKGINKAIGEIDILFTYLKDSCLII